MICQLIDLFGKDEPNPDYLVLKNADGNRQPSIHPRTIYTITLFGRSQKGNTIVMKVFGYRPYYYVELRSPTDRMTIMESEFVEESNPVEEKTVFRGYQFGKKRSFLKLSFSSLRAFRASMDGLTKRKFSLYESNVDPLLRFLHDTDINPCGWIEVDSSFSYEKQISYCDRNIRVRYDQVKPYTMEEMGIAPLRIVSFDIEASSSHGDFPVAKKTYHKMAVDMTDYIKELLINRKKILFVHLSQFMNWVFGDDHHPWKLYTKHQKRPDRSTIDAFIQEIMKKIMGIRYEKNAWKTTKEELVKHIVASTARHRFPEIEGDEIIQIGTVLYDYGDMNRMKKLIFTLDTCDPLENIEVISCTTERELLCQWFQRMSIIQPDVVIGYNIFGFDYKFIHDRALELDCLEAFLAMGKLRHSKQRFVEKQLVSAGLGDNQLYFLDMKGSVQVDVLKVVQRDHKLVSYKLDAVSGHFIGGNVLYIREQCVYVDNVDGLHANDYVVLSSDEGSSSSSSSSPKYHISEINQEGRYFIVAEPPLMHPSSSSPKRWGLCKDDISPKEIFTFQKENSYKRSLIAKYCIQDCALVLHLFLKLDILPNNMGMSRVCRVPLSFIFLRGQGIKTYSLMLYKCTQNGFVIPIPTTGTDDDLLVIGDNDDNDDNDDVQQREGYEGAIVLPPKPKIYLEEPIAVLDYASLYPSSMISENLSHDTIVMDPMYHGEDGGKRLEDLGLEYADVEYDNYIFTKKGTQTTKKIHPTQPRICCRYIQPVREPDGTVRQENRGIVPQILMELLNARKKTRQKMKKETDPFKLSILDGLQLAYKITANSIYGSIGASTNTIYFKDIAASTTAVGRRMLYFAKDYVETHFPGAEAVYGDTDSIFINFHPTDENDDHDRPLRGEDALRKSIELGIAAGKAIQPLLKYPHDLEYEKTFWPFILFSKKRYVGNKYEMDPQKYKLSSMGIVLKRRDNAPLLKHVYGELIDHILNKKDIMSSLDLLRDHLLRILQGHVPLEDLIITKSLRSRYENPDQIVHKVLADRIAERDPGNKPQPNDRIPYVYIVTPGKPALQGDRVEHPDFIREHSLEPDYLFYITNQISNPVCKLYSLVLEELPMYKKPLDFYSKTRYHKLRSVYEDDETKIQKKIEEEKIQEACRLLIDPVIQPYKIALENRLNKNREITHFFSSSTINGNTQKK